tara:strand:+ start:5502 stop:6476 length:975 start_codon:yes stop_codon:yes gene_type:complete
MPTKKELNQLYRDPTKSENYDAIVQDLYTRGYNNEPLSLAEECFIGGIIEQLRDKDNNRAHKIEDFEGCKNYHFRSRYLRYVNDLNGHKQVMDYYGPIPEDLKVKDITFLQKTYEEWKTHLEGKINGFRLINYVAQELKHQLKEVDRFALRLQIGSRYKEYLRKTLFLHAKYIFLLVKEFYEELGQDEEYIEIQGNVILVDGFTYVHTMFRHYASHIKQHQMNKSYHFDQNIGFKEIPNFLLKALQYFKAFELPFNGKSIYFNFNGKPYAIWFRLIKKSLPGGIQKEYLRVQTFYPIENPTEKSKLSKMLLTPRNKDFSFYFSP